MFRVFASIVIAAILLGIIWELGTIPGTVIAHSGTYTVQATVPAVILFLVALALLLTLLLWLVRRLWRAPGSFGDWRGGRRQRLGEIATQRGIVALAAGDAKGAEAEAGRARKLLGNTPLVLLIAAESARLAGKSEQANAAFKQLTQHKELAFLGHRGLLRHHLALGDHDTAAGHALAAEDAYPGGAWLQTQRLDIAVKKQDFRAALGLTRKPAEIAALATAASAAASNPKDAFSYAKQAIKAVPALAPAIAAYAGALRRLGRDRAARSALAKGWAQAPHPMIAAAYLEKISAPIERAQAAGDLAKANPGHPESELLLAETALAAQLTGEAKRHATAAIAAGLNDKRPYTVLATLDPNPDTITTAANAPAPKWSCTNCAAETTDWTAACTNCGKPGTLLWKTTGRALVVAA
jgi:HemY protein